MGTPAFQPGDLQVAGNIIAGGVIASSQAYVNDAAVLPGTIAVTKLGLQPMPFIELFGPTTTTAALTKWVWTVNGTTDSLVNFRTAMNVVPTGDHTTTVDLQRSTGGGAFASVLGAVITFNSSSTAKTIYTATPTVTLAQNDILQVVVAITGSTGSQGTGLVAQVVARETAS